MGDYNPISGFLEKFRKIIFQKEEIKSLVVKTIEGTISHKVDENIITIKNGYVTIKGSPILRSEIFLRKSEILKQLKEVIPNYNFIDLK